MAQREYTSTPMDKDHDGDCNRSCYVHLRCRTPEARKANADYKRNKAGDNRALTASTNTALNAAGIPFADPKLRHGLLSTYQWWGCKCDACKAANTRAQSDARLVRILEIA